MQEATDASEESGDTNTKKSGRKKKERDSKTKSTEEKAKHYTSRKCPLCRKEVCNMKRHIIQVYVKKNECLPMARVAPLVEMAIHKDKTRGGKVIKLNKGVKKIYQRKKEICPKCDRVVMYLTAHLRRTHGYHREDEEYHALLRMAR